jgi:shikimate dehydrogenase
LGINTIKITKGKLKGYNTDYYGFKKALEPLQPHHKSLDLRKGAPQKAAFALDELNISYTFVSRNKRKMP